jgi:large subunit ribosomal protein L18
MLQKHNKSQSRALRVRSSVKTSGRPRLTVLRTNAHIWAQLINDQTGVVIAAVSTKSLKGVKGTKTEKAIMVGKALAEASIAQKITKVVFDRGAYKYHGRVKALADAARTVGLEF